MANTNQDTQRILLLGAGTLGLPILRALATHQKRSSSTPGPNTSITLASRNPSAPALAPILSEHSIQPLPLDVVQAPQSELAKVFSHYTTVISCNGMYLPAGTQLKLARAAIDSGVRRYFPWQFGVDYDAMAGSSKQDLFTEQLEVRKMLRAQDGIKWTIVSTGVFSDFLVGPEAGFGVVEWKDGREGVVVRGLGGWRNRVTSTKVEDIARVVAGLVYDDPERNGVVFVAGQTVSYLDVAEAVEAALGKECVTREEWPVPYLERQLEQDPENGMRKYRCAFAEGTGVAWDEDKTWNRQHGIELSRIGDWISSYLLK